jgi:hypothetical protein
VVDQKSSGNPDRNVGHREHARFSPKAAPKRNPYVDPGARKDPAGYSLPLIVLMRLRAISLASSQFVDEMLQMGRWTCRFRTQHLLKTFAHGIADCPAGLVIERFDVVICMRAFHDCFRIPVISVIG